MVINDVRVFVSLLILHTTLSSLPPECLMSGPGPPKQQPEDAGSDKTTIMLGYLTAVRRL